MLMDWIALLLSLGLFGVLLAFLIQRIWTACEESKDRHTFLHIIKKELEKCSILLKGEGNLLPIDMWKSAISTGSLRLIPYGTKISLAEIYFRIECHNYEAGKVRDISILSATTKEKPKAKIDAKLGKTKVSVQTPWTHAELLHSELSTRMRKSEQALRKDIDELLKQNIWN